MGQVIHFREAVATGSRVRDVLELQIHQVLLIFVVTQNVEDTVDRGNPKPRERETLHFWSGKENFPYHGGMEIFNWRRAHSLSSSFGIFDSLLDELGEEGRLEVNFPDITESGET